MAAGAAIGAASGAIVGKMTDYGIPDQFMKDLATKLQPGTSMLFILFRKVTWEKVLPDVSQYGGTLVHSSLTPEAEAWLQSALTEAGAPKAA
jgi:uncharacterized membrane protein